MTAINAVTDYALDGDVGVITLNSPPVNALSFGVRDGLAEGMAKALADPGANSGRLAEAIEIFRRMTLAEAFEEFLTLPAYEALEA